MAAGRQTAAQGYAGAILVTMTVVAALATAIHAALGINQDFNKPPVDQEQPSATVRGLAITQGVFTGALYGMLIGVITALLLTPLRRGAASALASLASPTPAAVEGAEPGEERTIIATATRRQNNALSGSLVAAALIAAGAAYLSIEFALSRLTTTTGEVAGLLALTAAVSAGVFGASASAAVEMRVACFFNVANPFGYVRIGVRAPLVVAAGNEGVELPRVGAAAPPPVEGDGDTGSGPSV